MKFCVQKGVWGHCPQQADGMECECVLTLTLLASLVCGYPHALLAMTHFSSYSSFLQNEKLKLGCSGNTKMVMV